MPAVDPREAAAGHGRAVRAATAKSSVDPLMPASARVLHRDSALYIRAATLSLREVRLAQISQLEQLTHV